MAAGWRAARGLVSVTYEDVVDGNGHRKQYRTDAFGRLVRVQEMVRDHPSPRSGQAWAPPA